MARFGLPLLALLAGSAFVSPAMACSCARGVSQAAHDASADAIFSGRVLAVDDETRTARIQVLKALKGHVSGTIAVRTQRGNCGLRFRVGEVRPRLRAHRIDRGTFYTSTCMYVTRP